MTSTATPKPGRIEVGWLLAGAGAILVLVSLSLDWFDPGLTGWIVFEALDLVLAAASLVVLAVAARSFGFMEVGETAGGAAAIAALVVVISQLLNHPPAATDLDIDVGGWLALAGATLMLVGALLNRTGVSLAVVLENSGERGRGQAQTPAPAPRPAGTEEQTAPLPPEPPR